MPRPTAARPPPLLSPLRAARSGRERRISPPASAAKAARPSTKSGPSAADSASARYPGVSTVMPAATASTARLQPPNRRLAQFGDAARIAQHGFLQGGLDPAVDQPDRQRLVGLDAPAAEQQVLGARRADEFDQPARLGMAVEQAELGGREWRDGRRRRRSAGRRRAPARARRRSRRRERPRWSDDRGRSAP